MRTYSALIALPTFLSRYNYLKLDGSVGHTTFGHDRHLNQRFYTSSMWKSVRDFVIVRDGGYDLGMPGHDIAEKGVVHHMNPMMVSDLLEFNEDVINPEYLILVSHQTHNAIHYGDELQLPRQLIERQPGDTAPWR